MFVALYADELVPYREIVRVLNLAVENNYQMVPHALWIGSNTYAEQKVE